MAGITLNIIHQYAAKVSVGEDGIYVWTLCVLFVEFCTDLGAAGIFFPELREMHIFSCSCLLHVANLSLH